MTFSNITLTTAHLQNNYAIVNCQFDTTTTFEQLRDTIIHSFPQRNIDTIYTMDKELLTESNFETTKFILKAHEIQLFVEFTETNELMSEISYPVLNYELDSGCSFQVGPAVKKLLKFLKIQLEKEEFVSVDEFFNSLPQCQFKSRLIEIKESTGEYPKFKWLSKRTGIPIEQLQNELNFILTNFSNAKLCCQCSKHVDNLYFQCLVCPHYILCCECEENNGAQPFHDESHVFAKLTQGNSVNMKELVKMRKILHRNCSKEKMCGKPGKALQKKEEKNLKKLEKKKLKEKHNIKELKEKRKAKEGKEKAQKKCQKKLRKQSVAKGDFEKRLNSLQETVEMLQNVILTCKEQ